MANLKLKNPSGGSLALVSADGASDLTVTFPAATGTAMVSGNMPAFSVYKSGSSQTSFSNSTATKVIFDAETFDTANCFDSTTNYRFTPNVAGYYQIQGCVETNYLVSQYGFYKVSIYKNGSEYVRFQLNGSTSITNYPSLSVSSVIYFNGSTDYVELYVYSINGNTPAYDQGSYATYMTGCLVRTA